LSGFVIGSLGTTVAYKGLKEYKYKIEKTEIEKDY
jgi:hypothetical protein